MDGWMSVGKDRIGRNRIAMDALWVCDVDWFTALGILLESKRGGVGWGDGLALVRFLFIYLFPRAAVMALAARMNE